MTDSLNRGYERAMIDILVLLDLKKELSPEEALTVIQEYARSYLKKAQARGAVLPPWEGYRRD